LVVSAAMCVPGALGLIKAFEAFDLTSDYGIIDAENDDQYRQRKDVEKNEGIERRISVEFGLGTKSQVRGLVGLQDAAEPTQPSLPWCTRTMGTC
jgi:hypothetical protein